MLDFTKNAKLVAVAAGLSVAALGAPAAAAELRAWNIHVEDYPNSIALESFAAEVADKTGGEVTIKLFHNGVLGSQPDAIEQVRLGALDIGQFNLGPMGTSIPETNVVSLPFIFPGIPEMYELMDGAVGDAISAGMEKKGMKALAWYDSGARSFYNSIRPINSPADVEGLKLRVMNNDLFVGMVEALDGNATPMAFGEVYQSIKTGVVDGAENNPPSYESVSHYEVAQYYSLTEHLIIPECVCVSMKAWDAMTPEQQEIVATAARNSATQQRELWHKIADKGPFQERMAGVYEGFLEANPDLTELVNLIRGTN